MSALGPRGATLVAAVALALTSGAGCATKPQPTTDAARAPASFVDRDGGATRPPRVESASPAVQAPSTLTIAPPVWETRQDTPAVLLSAVDECFSAALATALEGRGFRLAAGLARKDGAADPDLGQVIITLHTIEGGGGVRVQIALVAEVTLRVGEVEHVVHGLRVTTQGEIVEGFEALGDVSTTLARLRAVTARESASRLGEEVAASFVPPSTPAPALLRKRAPIESAWAVPVAGRLPLHPWDEIDAGLEAEPGLTGSVRVSSAAGVTISVVPLLEARPGHYVTRLGVPPGVPPGLLSVAASLVDATGRTESVALGAGALLADTDRPLPPAGLVVRRVPGKNGGYELTWSYRPESGVVHHYRVFRSDGFPYRFQSVGETRETRFTDPLVVDEHGFFDLTRRYYTVLGYDAAGNPSPPSELVSISPDPTATEGTVLFAPGRPRAEEAAARRDKPPVVARYRLTTRSERPGRLVITGQEVGDPRATLTFATGRAVREPDGGVELVVVALGSESASAEVSAGGDPRWWPLAEIEPGTYAGSVPLPSFVTGQQPAPSAALPARLSARLRLRDAAGFEAIGAVEVPASIATPGTVPAPPPSEGEPEDDEPDPGR